MPKIHDRGIIKWAPFDSVISSKKVIRDIENSKHKIVKPILSEDELNNIESIILDSYHNKDEIEIKYFYNGKYYKIKNIISKIDNIKKIIVLDNNKKIYFNQIVSVKNN